MVPTVTGKNQVTLPATWLLNWAWKEVPGSNGRWTRSMVA